MVVSKRVPSGRRLRFGMMLLALGLTFLGGCKSKKDMTPAMKALQAKAQAGDVEAAAQLGMEYRGNQGYTANDDAEAVRWFRMAAEGGDRSAMYLLAEYYEQGKFLDKDPREANVWYLRAAKLGHTAAKDKLKAQGLPTGDAEAAAPVAKQPEMTMPPMKLPGGVSLPGGSLPGVSEAKARVNTPEDLKALFTEIQTAIRAGDQNAAGKLGLALLWPPNESRLRAALRDDAPPDAVAKLLALNKEDTPTYPMMAKLFTPSEPNRTEIQVHAATTEQIIAYEKGSVAFAEFPGGAKRVAATVLRPGMTFYEVEAVEPGKDSGNKWHLFYWDGSHWTMLGPVWRTLGT